MWWCVPQPSPQVVAASVSTLLPAVCSVSESTTFLCVKTAVDETRASLPLMHGMHGHLGDSGLLPHGVVACLGWASLTSSAWGLPDTMPVSTVRGHRRQ
ncbi:hypothetical protein C8Q78DRAFT_1024825 [Trametes maxima]|nr:hypothetical protein C8Q78DRAFT_1024825 [Trametes maxima]